MCYKTVHGTYVSWMHIQERPIIEVVNSDVHDKAVSQYCTTKSL